MQKLLFILTICIFTFNANAQKKKRKTTKQVVVQSVKAQNVVPECVKKLIEKFSKEERQEPAKSIYSYTYKGKTVYYVTPPCCDFFSDLYDENCNLIGHPDGGFTGKGDMKMMDFNDTKTNEKVIWKDERK
jgi:hypothetical protein